MNQPQAPRANGARRPRPMRRVLALTVLLGATLAVLPVLSSSPGLVNVSVSEDCPVSRTMRMVEANVKSGMTDFKTNADLDSVYAVKPDFIAYNEVPYRADSVLARTGYQIWRSPGRYIGANAVVWRKDRWTPIARGTIYISNVPGKVAGQTSEWGIRYANWATLRSTDGCQTVSIVSYHAAPKNAITEGLTVPSVIRLGALTKFLAKSGPVLLAGDLNSHYNGREYPRAELTAGGMTPTYDMTGTKLVTHDGGATIDYVFVNRAEQFQVTKQVTHELYSDHDLLIVDLKLDRTVPVTPVSTSFMRGHVVNVPESTLTVGRDAVVHQLNEAIRNTAPGQTLRFVTGKLMDKRIRAKLGTAFRNGVIVKFVTTNPVPNVHEKALMDLMGTSRSNKSYAIARSGATASSLGFTPTALLASVSAGKRYVRIDVDQVADPVMMSRQTARASIYTQLGEYDALRHKFDQLVQ
ncbi:MAG: endonuclease/exonuclease/phosphatase family protein [Propionibacteriales bacterium]|nr:endonuclease/exonuclease/phosphatase family protein [Propionibacteriales bacterium]